MFKHYSKYLKSQEKWNETIIIIAHFIRFKDFKNKFKI